MSYVVALKIRIDAQTFVKRFEFWQTTSEGEKGAVSSRLEKYAYIKVAVVTLPASPGTVF